MAQQTINIGASPNDGTGTPLRTAFDYTNQNFTELYTATGPSGNNIVVPGSATITGDLTVGTGANAAVQKGSILGGYTVFENSAGTGNPSITFNNDIDTGLLSPAANTIAFAIGGSEAMRLNSTGLGVGVSPNDKLTVLADNYLSFQTSTLTFNSGRVGRIGAVSAGSGNGYLVFETYKGGSGGGERMRIDSDGNVGVGLAPSASGGCLQLKSGITFPATQVASSDANTLDDYEEGTWTIGIAFGGASTGITYSQNTGKYTKVGRLVTVFGAVDLTNKGSATGNASITGLPFSIGGASSDYSAASLQLVNITFADFPMGFGNPTTTTIPLQEVTNAGVRTNLTDADFANNSAIIFSLTYSV